MSPVMLKGDIVVAPGTRDRDDRDGRTGCGEGRPVAERDGDIPRRVRSIVVDGDLVALVRPVDVQLVIAAGGHLFDANLRRDGRQKGVGLRGAPGSGRRDPTPTRHSRLALIHEKTPGHWGWNGMAGGAPSWQGSFSAPKPATRFGFSIKPAHALRREGLSPFPPDHGSNLEEIPVLNEDPRLATEGRFRIFLRRGAADSEWASTGQSELAAEVAAWPRS